MTPKITFLTIPAELRIIIYEMVTLRGPYFIKHRLHKPRYIQLARFHASRLPFLSFQDTPIPQTKRPTVFRNLRLCSRQIYAETKQYIYYPPVNLTIMDNRLLEFSSACQTFDLLHLNSWLQASIQTVEIKIWYFELTLTHHPDQESMFFPDGNNTIPLTLRDKTYPWPYNTLTETGKSLKRLTEYLKKLPQLESFVLNVDPSNSINDVFFKKWNDPLGDAELLYPLKERGVQVGIKSTYKDVLGVPPESLEKIHLAFEKMMSRKKFWRKMRGAKTDERSDWEFLKT